MTIRVPPDIDGLRAIAVLSVVFYHYGIGPIRGGFVGVDVFYVISGFLITRIIHREIEEGRFSYANFYERRIRRIFPALFAMLAVTLAVGAWLLLPSDLVALSRATVATLLFGSNILFWRQSGYFDPSSDHNPLLHTWSLAVEEQFYIVFPIALMLIARFARRSLAPILALAAIASLLSCVVMQRYQPAGTFYLSPFRAWELALGGLIAIEAVPPLRSRLAQQAVAALGLLTLAGSVLWVKAGNEFPGWQAIFPVVGSAAIIYSGQGEPTATHRLLGHRAPVFVGLISYSLYLWHWPIVVAARYAYASGLTPIPLSVRLALVALSIAVACASYRFVETPFRKRREGTAGLSRSTLFAGSVTVALCLGVAALGVGAHDGWPHRFPERALVYERERQPVVPFEACSGHGFGSMASKCMLGNQSQMPRAILWGDSHAVAWAPALDTLAAHDHAAVKLAFKSACPPLIDVAVNYGLGCGDFVRQAVKWIERVRPQRVYLMAAWTDYSNDSGLYTLSSDRFGYGNEVVFPAALRATIERISPYVGEIVLIGPTPGAPNDIPFSLAMAEARNAAWPPALPAAYVSGRNAQFWKAAAPLARIANVTLVDPAPWFCDRQYCKYADGRTLLYRDNGHLSLAGARFIAPRLAAAAPVQADAGPLGTRRIVAGSPVMSGMLRRWGEARKNRRIAYLNDLRRHEMDEVMRRFGPLISGRRVLEIGSGTGAQLDHLASLAAGVTGIDIAGSNYAEFRDPRIVVYDGHAIPFPDGSFDVVFSSNVLEHIAHRDTFQREIARVLAPDGACIHVVPNHHWRLFSMATQLVRFPFEAAVLAAASLRDRRWHLPASGTGVGHLLVGPRHGEFGTFLSEAAHMRPRVWQDVFERNGWSIESAEAMNLVYSGNCLFGGRLGFPARTRLAGLLGSSMTVFHLRRNAA